METLEMSASAISSFRMVPATSGLPSTPDLGEIRERVRGANRVT
jgi:hypothetical protein